MWKYLESHTWNLNVVKKVLSLKSGIFLESWAYPPCGWFLKKECISKSFWGISGKFKGI